MDLTLFIITAVFAVVARYFSAFRELHMLQLSSYQFLSHFNRAKKNFAVYIPYLVFLIVPILFATPLYEIEIMKIVLPIALCVCSVAVIILNLPKKFKKPFVYTARVKRMIVTLTILTIIPMIIAVLAFLRQSFVTAYFTVGLMLCLSPVAALLSNLINYPVEEYIRRWYINDAKKILGGMKDMGIVGITGSYGKTSMKFYLGELMNSKYSTLITPESYNTPMGVVKTIRTMMKATHERFICEMGARHIGDIKELCDIVFPQDGIITSIGPQHLETFKNIDNIISTKFELADSVNGKGILVVNGDNEYIRKGMTKYNNVITYGFNENNDYKATDISVSFKGTTFRVIAKNGESCNYETSLLGEHNVLNLLGAITYCCEKGFALDELIIPVRRISAVKHRLELIDAGGDLCYIDDAYNSNPNGCRAALSVLSLFDCYKILCTPGMVELGEEQDRLNEEFGEEAADVCDYVALVGRKQTEPILKGLKAKGFDEEKIFIADSLSEAIENIKNIVTEKKKIVLLENDLPDNY
ncbi:MAG: Mur ligase family protein [Oscillospiraceae bacterium]